jgi:hypothetical protein
MPPYIPKNCLNEEKAYIERNKNQFIEVQEGDFVRSYKAFCAVLFIAAVILGFEYWNTAISFTRLASWILPMKDGLIDGAASFSIQLVLSQIFKDPPH